MIPSKSELQLKLSKFHGQLREVARVSGCSYTTIVKLAGGVYDSSPTLRTVDLINRACDALLVPPVPKLRDAKRKAA